MISGKDAKCGSLMVSAGILNVLELALSCQYARLCSKTDML
jgi:hypothetical protein